MTCPACGQTEGGAQPPGRHGRMDAATGQRWLAFAASPVFALMALASALAGSDAAAVLCGGTAGSAVNSMATMYLLMGVLHAGPWLRLAHRA